MKLHKMFDRRGRRGLSGFLAKILLISLVMGMFQIPVSAAGTECSTSGPVSAVYSVTVCITAPADAAIVSGVQNVTTTVTVTGTNPGVAKLIFYLDGAYLLTDFQAPFSFKLPTTKWVDAIRTLEVEARMRDTFISTRASISLDFVNGIIVPPVNTNTFTPATGTTPPAGQPFVLAATGDGASGVQNSDAVADLIEGWDPNMMLYLGGVYDQGTPTEFYNWYGAGGEYYSRFNAITNPTVGSQEYADGAALGYFDYWDNVPNYYSFDAAGWHIISLDSSSQFDETDPGTDQYDWLVDDLNDSDAVCTMAYFHHPVFNVGQTGETTRLDSIWALLAQRGVDIVLTSRDNSYQRWHPMNGVGVQDSSGVTQFVIGTGGHNMQAFIRTDSNLAAGFDTSAAFGGLRLELNSAGAAFQFINLQGNVLDSGSVPCSGVPADTTPPSTPTNLTAPSSSSNKVNLTWKNSTDNVGVTGYEIYRDGLLLTTITPPATSYLDDTVAPGVFYSYRIRAR
ncbi:MAG TPA: Ig-like domain-containing protein, partial [Anaerolineales bacterium]